MPNNDVKPPLGQVQERFDIKGGLSRKMASHQNEPNSWWDILNFRFYKENIFTFYRKATYSVLAPTTQTLTIPSQTCSVNSNEPIVPFGMWGYGQGGGPGGFSIPLPIITSETIYVVIETQVNYQVKVNNIKSTFSATNLPDGLVIDSLSGVISGIVASPSLVTYTVNLFATNAGGTSEGFLTIVMLDLVTATFTENNNSGVPSIFEVAIDGGDYLLGVDSQVYNPLHQLKYRLTIPTGVYAPSGGVSHLFVAFTGTRTLGTSISTAVGDMVFTFPHSDLVSIWNPLFDPSPSPTANNGIFNVSQAPSGSLPSAAKTGIFWSYAGIGLHYTVTTAVFETILNF